jgi:integrase
MKGCRPFEPDEIIAVMNVFSQAAHANRNKLMFIFGIKTGFRISEILSLTIGDVYKNGHIVDIVEVQKMYMKGETESRQMKLTPNVQTLIAKYLLELDDLNPNLHLFTSCKSDKKPMSRVNAWMIIKNAANKCNLQGKLATHSMRKTYADNAYEECGHDLAALQQLLGHKYANTTTNYLSYKQVQLFKFVTDRRIYE